MVQRVVASVPGTQPRPIRRPRRHERLTPREKQVVGRVVAGASNAEIARELGVSIATAKRHLANVMLKWHCANRTQVAIDALRRAGFVDSNRDYSSRSTT